MKSYIYLLTSLKAKYTTITPSILATIVKNIFNKLGGKSVPIACNFANSEPLRVYVTVVQTKANAPNPIQIKNALNLFKMLKPFKNLNIFDK